MRGIAMLPVAGGPIEKCIAGPHGSDYFAAAAFACWAAMVSERR